MSWENTKTDHSRGPFDSSMVNFLKRLLITFFMAMSWVILALCIRLSPASGADISVNGLPQTGRGIQGEAFSAGEYPDARDISISIGRTAFEIGDYDTAVTALDQALADRPYFSAADPGTDGISPESRSQMPAMQHFQEALSVSPQQEVESNINENLRALKSSRKEHFLSAKISLGLDYEDAENAVSAGTGTTASLSDAVTVTLDRPEKGQKHTSTASFDYLYRPKGSAVSWKFSGMNYMAAYRENKDLDVNLYDFKAGASISRNKFAWDIYGTANHLSRGFGQYLRTYGAGTTMNYAFTSYFRVSVDGKVKMKNYVQDDNLDSRNVSLSVSPKLALGRNRISLSVGLEQEDARDEINSYMKINGNATYEVVLPFASSAYVSYWYKGTEYKDIASITGRRDEVHYVSTGLTKNIPVWKSTSSNIQMDLNLKYTYTRSDSSIDLYAYTKNVLSSGMSVVF